MHICKANSSISLGSILDFPHNSTWISLISGVGSRDSWGLSLNHVALNTWDVASICFFLTLVIYDSSLKWLFQAIVICQTLLSLSVCRDVITALKALTLIPSYEILYYHKLELQATLFSNRTHAWSILIVFDVIIRHFQQTDGEKNDLLHIIPAWIMFPNAPLFIPELQTLLKTLGENDISGNHHTAWLQMKVLESFTAAFVQKVSLDTAPVCCFRMLFQGIFWITLMLKSLRSPAISYRYKSSFKTENEPSQRLTNIESKNYHRL